MRISMDMEAYLLTWLQIKQNLVTRLLDSMILRRAVWASAVKASASSRMISLNGAPSLHNHEKEGVPIIARQTGERLHLLSDHRNAALIGRIQL